MIEIEIRSHVVGKLDESVRKCVIESVSDLGIFEYTRVRDLTQDFSNAVHMRLHWSIKTTNWNT